MNTSLKKYLFSYLLVISCFAHLNSDGQVLSFNNSDLKSMSIVKDSSKKSYLLLFCKNLKTVLKWYYLNSFEKPKNTHFLEFLHWAK